LSIFTDTRSYWRYKCMQTSTSFLLQRKEISLNEMKQLKEVNGQTHRCRTSTFLSVSFLILRPDSKWFVCQVERPHFASVELDWDRHLLNDYFCLNFKQKIRNSQTSNMLSTNKIALKQLSISWKLKCYKFITNMCDIVFY
jgi:hypothetical protein